MKIETQTPAEVGSRLYGFKKDDVVFFNLSVCVVGQVEDTMIFLYPKEQPHEWLGNGRWVSETEIAHICERCYENGKDVHATQIIPWSKFGNPYSSVEPRPDEHICEECWQKEKAEAEKMAY